MGGTTPGSGYDQIDVTGKATLGGTLDISLINNFSLQANDTFEILKYGSVEGDFDTIIGQWTTNDIFLNVTKGANSLTLEALSVSDFYTATSGVDMTLKVEFVNNIETLRRIDSSDTELASMAVLSINSPLRITGSSSNDTLTVGIDTEDIPSVLPYGIRFDGGSGTDTLIGANADTVWNLISGKRYR